MSDDGWIVHDGKGCPVPLDSKPGVRFRDGDPHHIAAQEDLALIGKIGTARIVFMICDLVLVFVYIAAVVWLVWWLS